MENNEIKKAHIKNRACYYFDDKLTWKVLILIIF